MGRNFHEKLRRKVNVTFHIFSSLKVWIERIYNVKTDETLIQGRRL